MTILVTGGTGTLGRAVAAQLGAAGLPVRVLSRRPARTAADEPDRAVGDLRSGTGLRAALDGVDAVIHCASDGRTPGADVEAARRLIAAGQVTHPHLVYVSIVGADRVPLRYYKEKFAVEQLVEHSGMPWTVLRATQFHDLILTMLRRAARMRYVLPVPAGTSFQPIDVPEVAAQLIRLATGLPVGRAPDLGGPQVRSAADLARAYLRAQGQRAMVLPVRLPGRVAAGYRAGGHLVPGHLGGGRTWDEYLADTVAATVPKGSGGGSSAVLD